MIVKILLCFFKYNYFIALSRFKPDLWQLAFYGMLLVCVP